MDTGQKQAGCGESAEISGTTASLPSLLLTGGVPDAVWTQAADVVADVVGEAGFGAVDVVVDNSGEHEIVLRGERIVAAVRTLANATLALQTGCHLPADVHGA